MPRPRSLVKSLRATDTNGRTVPPRAKPLAAAMLPPPIVKSASGAPPLTRVASALARRFHLICSTMLAEVLTGEEVVQLEYGTLLCLEIERGIDQRRLAEAMGIDPTNASLIIDRLHSKGLVERRVKETDRRAHSLYLTPKGRALWRRLRPKTSAANERVLAPLTQSQRELFLDLLILLIEGNRAHARPGAGRRKRRNHSADRQANA
jgi:DNA-binding MarR family transcriptional regulator